MVASYNAQLWSSPGRTQPPRDWLGTGTEPYRISAPFAYDQRMSEYGLQDYGPMPRGQVYGPISAMGNRLIDETINDWLEREHPELFEFETGMWGNPVGSAGKVGSIPGFAGGNFTPQQDAAIQRAADQYGVPPNFLKAIITHESSGDWQGNGYRTANLRNDTILPYIGVFYGAARSWGHPNPASLIGDLQGQTDLLAMGLRRFYDQLRKQNPQWGWQNVAAYHYSGDPTMQYTPADSYQYGTTEQYVGNVMEWWGMLDRAAGSNSQGYDPGPIPDGASGPFTQVEAIWGGGEMSYSQGLERTNFSMYEHPEWYQYGVNYGLDGVTHTGIDYRTVDGTKLYTPVAGTVAISGGSGYYLDDRYGNSPGTGELRILLDNGHELILGHMSQIAVPVGTRVNPGQYVGLSGTANGDHVHVEYRVPDPGTATGMRIVDPAQALGGVFSGTYQQGAVGPGISRPLTFNDLMRQAASGRPINAGATLSSGSGWHDWLRSAMAGNVKSWDQMRSAAQPYNPWARYQTPSPIPTPGGGPTP